MDIREFAAALAAALGPEWSLAPITQEWHKHHPVIAHNDGPNFWLSTDGGWNPKGSIGVHANYPIDSKGREQRPPSWSDYVDPGINFTQKKSPEQAAKDITRRFLPAYLPLWAKQLVSTQASDDWRAKRKALAEAVVGVLGGTVIEDNDGVANVRLRYYPDRKGPYVSEVKLSSTDTIEFTISGNIDSLKVVSNLLK